MPRLDWRTAVKGLAGFLAGLALWVTLSPLYDGLVAGGAGAAMRLFERPSVTKLSVEEKDYVIVDRTDFDPRSKRPGVPLDDLTFNVILLVTLFAMEQRPFSDRNILGFVLASLLLYLTHVFGLITEVMSIYVMKLGPWSRVHYGDVARNFWTVANHFYRLVLMYALAFALWWILRDARGEVATAKRKKKR